MKKIGIDARLLFQTGVGTYLQNLLYHLNRIQNNGLEYSVYIMPQDRDEAKRMYPKINFVSSPFRWHTLAEQVGFGLQLMKDNLSLMHFTYFGHPVWYNRPFISTVHDLTPLFHLTGRASTANSLLFALKKTAYRRVLAHQVQRSICIITPSQSVKDQIISYFGDQSLKRRVVPLYEGVSFRLIDSSLQNLKRIVEKPYYLYVGNYYPHKNVWSLLAAFSQLKTQRLLVLAGPQDYFHHVLQTKLAEYPSRSHIRFVSAPTAHDIASLYAHCEAVINPSFSEGFGLPIIEAAYFKKPVIASEIPVFREILGMSMYGFDPYSVESIRRTLEMFEGISIPQFAATVTDMSFKTMAESTQALYRTYA